MVTIDAREVVSKGEPKDASLTEETAENGED